jgi:hypothetical protein
MGIQDEILEIRDNGYCVIRQLLDPLLVEACRAAFWPTLLRLAEYDRYAARDCERPLCASLVCR